MVLTRTMIAAQLVARKECRYHHNAVQGEGGLPLVVHFVLQVPIQNGNESESSTIYR